MEEQGIYIVVIGRKGRDSGAKNGREKPMYTPSSEKLWLSSNIKLKWEPEQKKASNLDLECNISFSHPRLSVANRWEKLKRIEKTLQCTSFRMFIIVNRKYINEKYWHAKQNKKLTKKIPEERSRNWKVNLSFQF